MTARSEDVFSGDLMILCPNIDCSRVMDTEPGTGYDATTGLVHMRCQGCGHLGMRARDGLQVLFSSQHEHVVSYGLSASTLKVVLSGEALNLFKVHGFTPAQLATYVAEWALVMGQTSGTVLLISGPLIFQCYEYFSRQTRTGVGITRREPQARSET